MEKYAHSAAQLAERMGAFREKELAMRDAFRKHVERWVASRGFLAYCWCTSLCCGWQRVGLCGFHPWFVWIG